MKFFTKVRQLTLSQSAMDCLIDYKLRQLSSLLQLFSLLQSTTGFITLRQGLQNVTIIPRATVRAFLHIPPPSLPSLEFKGMP